MSTATNVPGGSGSSAIRHMLRERIELLLGQWRSRMAAGWDDSAMAEIVTALNRLSDAAGKFQVQAPALAARDAAAYLGFLLDGGIDPNLVQRARLLHYLDRLAEASAELAELLLREELERPAVLYVRTAEREISGLEAALREQKWKPIVANAVAEVPALVKGRSLVAVVVDSGWLEQLGEIVDAIDQNRRTGPTPPLLVITRDDSVTEQLLGMTGSADAFIANVDAAAVVRKLGDLQQTLSSTEPLRVLIVDDDRTQVMFCDSVLRRRGITTRVANTSREALSLVPSFRPDLILVDLYMPEIDGMALTARIREMPGTLLLPIVFISGEQDVGKRVRAINVGADDFLTKPVRPAHLLDVVIGRAKRARALRRQVLGSPQNSGNGPLSRAALALRLRNLSERPAALISVGLEQSESLSGKLPSLLRFEVEQALAGRIAARVGPGDAFAPWNDLHFLVLAARGDESELHQLAQSFRSGIDIRPAVVSSGQIKVTARVQLTAADEDPQRWLDRALATWSQRTTTSASASGQRQIVTGRIDSLPPAPRASDAVLYPQLELCQAEYQPLIPARGMIGDQWHQRLRLRATPAQTIGVLRSDIAEAARHAGTLATLDRMALKLALDNVRFHRDSGRSVRIQVEVDLATLIDPGLLPYLTELIRANGRQDPGLTLELDTDGVIERQMLLRPVIDSLRQIGIQLCLRDFGMQKEAPRLLQQINVDAIKLDTDLALQPTIAFATIMAQVRDSGVPIQVEDVPDRAAITSLWELGADYIQCDLLRPHGADLDFDFQALVA